MSRKSIWREPAGVTAVLAVLAIVLYGMIRVCTARFYGPLGVRVEDLDLGYPGLIEESIGASLYAVVLAIPFVVLAMAGAWLWKRLFWYEHRAVRLVAVGVTGGLLITWAERCWRLATWCYCASRC